MKQTFECAGCGGQVQVQRSGEDLVAAIHQDGDRQCAGVGLIVVDGAGKGRLPTKRQRSNGSSTTKAGKDRAKAATNRKERDQIRQTNRNDREDRQAVREEEYGSTSSVRSVSGGLPGLGKRS